LLGDKDHARDGFFFEHLEQIVFVLGFQIEEFRNVPSGSEFFVERVEEILHFATSAGDYHIFLGAFVECLAVIPVTRDPIAKNDKQEAHDETEAEGETARVELFGENRQHADDQKNDQYGLEELLDGCAAFFGAQIFVVTEALEHHWSERYGDVEDPIERFAQGVLLDAHAGFDAKVIAQEPSDPESKPDEEGVGELKQLGAECFAAAVGH